MKKRRKFTAEFKSKVALEALREQQADLWLGFDKGDLAAMATAAGLTDIVHTRIPSPWCGEGPDRHLTWQLLSGHRACTDSG